MHPADPPIRQALTNVRACRALLATEGWTWLAQALETRMTALTEEVMTNDLPHEARDHRIHEHRVLKEWLRYPETQLAASLAVLEAAGSEKDADGGQI